MIDFEALSAPFPPERVSWRVGPKTKDKSKGMALAYIDARDVMERLDEVCGPANWQCRYPHANGKTVCEIGVNVFGNTALATANSALEYPERWVWKSDGAGDTDNEAEKGALSDAFKRAAVRFGIGRYLYDIPSPWVSIEPHGNSHRIAPGQEDVLSRVLGAAKPAPAPPPTNDQIDTKIRMVDEINAWEDTTDAEEWRTKPENIEAFRRLPHQLSTAVQKAATEKVKTLPERKESVNLTMAG